MGVSIRIWWGFVGIGHGHGRLGIGMMGRTGILDGRRCRCLGAGRLLGVFR